MPRRACRSTRTWPSDAGAADRLDADRRARPQRDALGQRGRRRQPGLGAAGAGAAEPQRRGRIAARSTDSSTTTTAPSKRKSRFLVAGLAGLGRLDDGDVHASAAGSGSISTAQTRVEHGRSTRLREVDNPALVALLAGLGMQGERLGQDDRRATSIHIVRALDRVGLDAEARMIAAEAVARG